MNNKLTALSLFLCLFVLSGCISNKSYLEEECENGICTSEQEYREVCTETPDGAIPELSFLPNPKSLLKAESPELELLCFSLSVLVLLSLAEDENQAAMLSVRLAEELLLLVWLSAAGCCGSGNAVKFCSTRAVICTVCASKKYYTRNQLLPNKSALPSNSPPAMLPEIAIATVITNTPIAMAANHFQLKLPNIPAIQQQAIPIVAAGATSFLSPVKILLPALSKASKTAKASDVYKNTERIRHSVYLLLYIKFHIFINISFSK